MEIKLTLTLDERAQQTIEHLIEALNGREATAKAPIKVTAETAPEPARVDVSFKSDTEPESTQNPNDITVEDMRALLADIKREKGAQAIKDVLRKHGAMKLSDLDPVHYRAVQAAVRAL